ncbi:hypothetical protein thalar_00723 [Litoreibacter arenae DSM 19593]|uniref:DUF4177 domain-containing protein n=1 Tax=Litoreibacter arenae DSM 19593 TaxID=1123360 RepID=S9QNT6_9RHOB|nr:hypothetical protein thalar_00723 [Litoreibacter arenae DSM 19593]
MQNYEYTAVPAPRKGKAPRKIKGNEAKFASIITDLMNEMAADGWDYQRAETLPCEERQGLTGKTVKYHTLLIFRREVVLKKPEEVASKAPPVVAVPVAKEAPEPELRPEPVFKRTEPEKKAEPASEGFMTADAKEAETSEK